MSSKRVVTRIDYAALHSRGVRIPKTTSNTSPPSPVASSVTTSCTSSCPSVVLSSTSSCTSSSSSVVLSSTLSCTSSSSSVVSSGSLSCTSSTSLDESTSTSPSALSSLPVTSPDTPSCVRSDATSSTPLLTLLSTPLPTLSSTPLPSSSNFKSTVEHLNTDSIDNLIDFDSLSSTSSDSNDSTLKHSSPLPIDSSFSADCHESTVISKLPTSPNWHTSTSVAPESLFDVLNEISNTKMSEEEVRMKELQGKVNVLCEDLNDFIDENPFSDVSITITDIDENVRRVEDIRSSYRELHRHILEAVGETEYTNKHKPTFDKNLVAIKNYIKRGKARKGEIRQGETAKENQDRVNQAAKDHEQSQQKINASQFLLAEVDRMMSQLNIVFGVDIDEDTNLEDLTARESSLSENLQEADRLSDKFQKLIETIPDSYPDKTAVIRQLQNNYTTVMTNKTTYRRDILEQIKVRELEKQKTFSASAIVFDLKKFTGYSSELDVYSFRTEFEKLFLRETPKNKLADLLKHNYLADPALSLVKSLDNIDEIWERLLKAYGDPKTILSKLLIKVKEMSLVCKSKSKDDTKDRLVKLINGVRDLIRVAEKHNIEAKLYNGDGIDIIYTSMGDARVIRWINSICDETLDESALWARLLKFLERELRVQQELSLHLKRTCEDSDGPSRHGHFTSPSNICVLCNEPGHATTKGPNGTLLVQYFACQKWVESTAAQRFRILRSKKLCHQCLFPGAKLDGKHALGGCQSSFVCPHNSHQRHPCKKHILVCHEHREDVANVGLLEEYKRKFISNQQSLPDFSKNIKLSFLSCYKVTPQATTALQLQPDDDDVVTDASIYMLQIIEVDGQMFTLFFDSGCSDMTITEDATRRLSDRAVQLNNRKLSLGGIGDVTTTAEYGEFVVRLPLKNGKNAVLIGVSLKKLTCEFPTHRLNGDVEKDIHDEFKSEGGDPQCLPSLRSSVGGQADIMIGAKYMRYFPKEIFRMRSGLTIAESPFVSSDGSCGVVCGPHKTFNTVAKPNGLCTSYYTDEYSLYKSAIDHVDDPTHEEYLTELENSFTESATCTNTLTAQESVSESNFSPIDSTVSYPSRKLKLFEKCENAGSEITFRCLDCRGCVRCRQDSRIEFISLNEEMEQDVINRSVTIDTATQKCTALLPLMHDPTVKLAPNKKCALRVYNRVLKSVEGKEEMKQAIIASEAKLQARGKVDWVHNLTPEQQEFLKNSPIQNFIPWRPVYNDNSPTTSWRLVFDGSAPTPSGYSLNDILAKGRNNLNQLVNVVIRFLTYAVAIHTDIEMMYNSVLLDEVHWCLQRYVFQKDLDPNAIPLEKIIKTVIYGLTPSGNQAECAMRETAKLSKDEFPRVCEVVNDEFYVDDGMTGEWSRDEAHELADNLDVVLRKGGFKMKGVTISGEVPSELLSKGKDYVNVGGMRWYPKDDFIQLNIKALNFNKKQRGKKAVTEKSGEIPKVLTKRILVSKVGEIFDLTGKVTPIVAHMKLDLRSITNLKLGWDDAIPDEFRACWVNHFEMMKEMSNIKYRRAIVPEDAAAIQIDTIDFGDASKELACSAVYVRFPRKDGTFSCQLIFSRSKILPEGTTQPRAELTASIMCTHTGEVVRKALSKYHKSSIKLTDSQIVLYWICNNELSLKPYVRDRIIEILRWTDQSQWHYIRSAEMIADLGTRPGAKISDVDENSAWFNGHQWMRLPVSEFPMKTYKEIRLDSSQVTEVNKELVIKSVPQPEEEPLVYAVYARKVPLEVGDRYKFSNYVLDPNRHDFSFCVRIIACCQRYIKNFYRTWTKKKGVQRPVLPYSDEEYKEARKDFVSVFTDEELKAARNYYFRLATKEIKHFLKPEQYSKISYEKDGVLFYTGRILPEQHMTSMCGMTAVMKDLSASTFFVPIVDKNSPIAYSITNEVHWNDKTAAHAGVETTLRYTLLYCHILEGRELVKKFTKSCERCRFLRKKTIEVAMGPVSDHQLRIAPAFYVSQVDLAGPFKAYTPHNKRATVKIYFAVFCCAATGTVIIKTMEDYNTEAFIMSFIRLACDVGYPKLLLTDHGSQLMKGCKSMSLNYRDIKNRLFVSSNVQFEACPVSGHFMHGRVERKIKQIKISLEKQLNNQRLSLLQWETIGAQIANSINNLPIGLGGKVSSLEQADLLTPNRLRLGRNNDRSPVGPMLVTQDVGKFMDDNKRIFNSWYEAWLLSYVPTLMHHPKWFVDDRDIKVGDVVLFIKEEGHQIGGVYQYGMVHKVEKGRDDKIRKVRVRYRNSNDKSDRFTERAVREIIIIHHVDELSIMTELAQIQTFVNMQLVLDDY